MTKEQLRKKTRVKIEQPHDDLKLLIHQVEHVLDLLAPIVRRGKIATLAYNDFPTLPNRLEMDLARQNVLESTMLAGEKLARAYETKSRRTKQLMKATEFQDYVCSLLMSILEEEVQ